MDNPCVQWLTETSWDNITELDKYGILFCTSLCLVCTVHYSVLGTPLRPYFLPLILFKADSLVLTKTNSTNNGAFGHLGLFQLLALESVLLS